MISVVNDALDAIKRVLEAERDPRIAEEVDHDYQNKYDFVNLLTNMTVIAQMNCLERLGLTRDVLLVLLQAHPTTQKATTLRFEATDSCSFYKEQTVAVPLEVEMESTEHSLIETARQAICKKKAVRNFRE